MHREAGSNEQRIEYREPTWSPLVVASAVAALALAVATDVILKPPAGRIVDRLAHPPAFDGVPNEWTSVGLVVMFVGFGVAFVALVTCTKLVLSPAQRRRSGRLSIDRGLLLINGSPKVWAVSGSTVVCRKGTHEVDIFDGGRRPRLSLLARSNEEAVLLAAAVNSAIEQGARIFRFTWSPRAGGGWPAAVGFFGALAAIALGLAFHHPVWLLAVPVFMVPQLLPVTVIVGADGLVVSKGMTRKFIPFADVATARAERGVLLLTYRTGRTTGVLASDDASALAAIAAQIGTACRSLPRGAGMAEILDRRDRAAHEWIAALRLLSSTDYRRPAINDDALWHVLASVGSSVTSRLAAAALLRPRMTDGDLARLRRVAATTSRELRTALEAIERCRDPLAEPSLLESLGHEQLPDVAETERRDRGLPAVK